MKQKSRLNRQRRLKRAKRGQARLDRADADNLAEAFRAMGGHADQVVKQSPPLQLFKPDARVNSAEK